MQTPISPMKFGILFAPSNQANDPVKAQEALTELKELIKIRVTQQQILSGQPIQFNLRDRSISDSNVTIIAPTDQYQTGLLLLTNLPGMAPLRDSYDYSSNGNQMVFTAPKNGYKLLITYDDPTIIRPASA
jgi:hypothetical protein